MRTRNKKIVLVESISACQGEKQSKFIEHGEAVIPMRIYHQEMEGEGHLAEIFYEAILNETIAKKQSADIHTYRSIKSTTLQTDASEKRLNVGKIVRRSLSKNCSKQSSPQKEVIKLPSKETISTGLPIKSSIQAIKFTSRMPNKQNSKVVSSCEKDVKTSRRSISNKKQIRYKVKPNIIT